MSSHQPDAVVRLRIAEARLCDQFVLIPIPLAAAEQATRDPASAPGLIAEYTDRYLPGADLFDDRNAIGDTMTFFGRMELLNRIEADLLKRQSVGLFGLRKSGKTSVLLQLLFALRRHPVVHVDLQPYGGNPRYGGQLFDAILQKLSTLANQRMPSQVLDDADIATSVPAGQLAVEFVRRVRELADVLEGVGYEPPIICFLDEVERILPSHVDSREKVEEFNACFGALRSLNQEGKQLALLVADVHPDCNRINQWSQAGVPTNPVYNFFKEVFLEPFSLEEATLMVTDIGRLMGLKFDDQTLAEIHWLSGGHPFVARQLCPSGERV